MLHEQETVSASSEMHSGWQLAERGFVGGRSLCLHVFYLQQQPQWHACVMPWWHIGHDWHDHCKGLNCACSSITLMCFFKRSQCGGRSLGVKLLRNSMEYWCSFSTTESELLYSVASPGKPAIIKLLTLSTSALVGQRMVLEQSQHAVS